MGRRTVRSAEAHIEQMASALNPEVYRQYQSEVDQARADAHSFASGVADDTANAVDESREQTLRTLCEVRDGYAQLAKDGQAGKLTASEFTARLNDLEMRDTTERKQLGEIVNASDFVGEIEEAPLDYADDHRERNPAFQYDFSF